MILDDVAVTDLVLTSFVAYGTGKAALNKTTENLAGELAPAVQIPVPPLEPTELV